MIILRLRPPGRVDLVGTVDLPLSAAVVWDRMRDFVRFTTLDPFHDEVLTAGRACRAGTKIVIRHRFAWFRVDRVGRILRWNDGIGYSFSDLSKRGRRAGFPHVFTYQVDPQGDG